MVARRGAADASVGASSYAFAAALIPPERRGRWFAYYNATFFLSWGVSATFVTGPLIDALMGAGTGVVVAYCAGFVSAALLLALGLGLLALLLWSMRRGDLRQSRV